MIDQDLLRALEDDPEASAAEAGLRYVSDSDPGFSRRRCGKGFSYRDTAGRTLAGKKRARIQALAIPPAWTEVWICPYDDGHIQATGRDEAGRKQYIYHPAWRRARDASKYARMLAFARLLPQIRKRVRRDLGRPGLPREKVLAAVVNLLETTLARVGNDEYAEKNQSYGLTTLRKKHVDHDQESGDMVVSFNGKGGKEWRLEIDDDRVEEVIRHCLHTPGRELFKYFDDDGERRFVTSADVNAYLEEITGANVHAKDFRTWAGTVLAAMALTEVERAFPDARSQTRILRAVEKVAEELGNTPTICRQCYIHPEVLDGFNGNGPGAAALERAQQKLRTELSGLRPEEAMVLAFLEKRLEHP